VDLSTYAVHVDGRPDHADLFRRLAAAASGPHVSLAAPLELPLLPPDGPALPADAAPASSLTSGDVTLDVPDANSITVTFADASLGALGKTFRSVRVAAAPDFAQGWAAAWALAPFDARSTNKLGVSVANTAGLPASAAVDFRALDDDYASPTLGQSIVVAQGHVSADGAHVDTDPGEGVLQLTWLGVQLKGQ
jgi:hypothetical protein